MARLKIGFIIDGESVDPYVYSLIRGVMQDKSNFTAPILISQNIPISSSSFVNKIILLIKNKTFVSSIARKFLSYIVINLELTILKYHPLHGNFGDLMSTVNLHLDTIQTKPKVSKSGFIHRFESQDLNKIKNCNIDVLIRCGTGILKGKILRAVKFGILSFHHGDNRVNRGTPAGFWEVFLNEPSTGFVIQQLTEVLDGGNILYRGNIMTASYWQLNYANIRAKSNIFILNILKNISKNNKLPLFENHLPYGSKLFKFPSSFVLIEYSFKQLKQAIKNRFLYLLNYRNRWSVSYIKSRKINSIMYNAKTIQNPPRRFLADPFVYSCDGKTVCFVEDYFYDEERGKISAYELTDEGHSDLGVILEEDFHLSFPYIFEHQNSIYMCPETAENEDIRLYKCNKFPTNWAFHTVLMKNVVAVDTVIFKFNKTWCMLSNICSSGMQDHNSELHLFFSDNPLSDSWKSFEKNPVIFNSLKARNGGLFKQGKTLYRVNQVHGKSHYGKAFEINRILQVNETEYSEEIAHKIFPSFFNNLKGTHHFDSNGEYCVFDHSKLERLK